jgi:hypothetical protein
LQVESVEAKEVEQPPVSIQWLAEPINDYFRSQLITLARICHEGSCSL